MHLRVRLFRFRQSLKFLYLLLSLSLLSVFTAYAAVENTASQPYLLQTRVTKMNQEQLAEGQLPDFPNVVMYQPQANSVLGLTQSVLDFAEQQLESGRNEAETRNYLKSYGIEPETAGIILYYVDAGYIQCSSKLQQLMHSIKLQH